MQGKNKYLFPLIVMAALFFLLGFITTMNNSMINFLKDAFKLGEVAKQLPNTFFYGAYILSVPVGFLINKIGYKKGVLGGFALEDLGPHAKIGSGVIATSVIGAALLTPMMGAIQRSAGLTIAICCLLFYYAYLVCFAAKGSKIR